MGEQTRVMGVLCHPISHVTPVAEIQHCPSSVCDQRVEKWFSAFLQAALIYGAIGFKGSQEVVKRHAGACIFHADQ